MDCHPYKNMVKKIPQSILQQVHLYMHLNSIHLLAFLKLNNASCTDLLYPSEKLLRSCVVPLRFSEQFAQALDCKWDPGQSKYLNQLLHNKPQRIGTKSSLLYPDTHITRNGAGLVIFNSQKMAHLLWGKDTGLLFIQNSSHLLQGQTPVPF